MGLFRSFNKFKNNTAITDGGGLSLSYKEVLINTYNIKKRIRKRSLILIISENSIGSLIAYVFCIIHNHVGIIINAKTNKDNIFKVFKNYQPDYVFLPEKMQSILKSKCIRKFNFFAYNLMKNKVYKKKKLHKDLSLLLSTSGSMGAIKFVKLSKSNLKNNTDSIIDYLKINNKDSSMTNLPISYSYMLSIINTHLEIGASIIVSKYSLIEKEFWQIFKNNKITSFNGVPYTYEILTKIGLKNIKINSLRYLTHAGGKLEKNKLKEILNFCKKNSLKFFSMYGQTEASPRISYLRPELAEKKIGSIGKGIKGNKIYLINKTGKKINKSFQEGEIVCEGKNVFIGYSENYKDLKKTNDVKYKLKTGDLGFMDQDGFFYITSRLNKIAKIFGNRIDLGILENLMNQKKYEIACLSDNKKIFVFTEKSYNKKSLISIISKLSNLNNSAFEVIKIKFFPRTPNNKISYSDLKKKHARL